MLGAAAEKQGVSGAVRRVRNRGGKAFLPAAGAVAFWVFAGLSAGLFLQAAQSSAPADAGAMAPGRAAEPPKGFVLLLTGNWQGQLQPCGCAEKQLGGIDRRTGLLESIPREQRLVLDSGPLVDGQGLQDDHKLDVFLASLNHLGYDAIALTGLELKRLEQRELDLSGCPAIVSCNVEPVKSLRGRVSCMVEKTLRVGERTLLCTALGLSEPYYADRRPTSADYPATLQNLQSACQAKGLDLRIASPDRYIVLLIGWANSEEFSKSLREFPGIDLVVSPGYSDEPEFCLDGGGGPARVTTGKLGKYLAQVEIPVDGAQDAKSWTMTRIAVEAHMPRDPVITGIIDEYQFKLMAEDLVADESRLPRRPLSEKNHFVGNESCGRSADCHPDIYQKWRSFKHGTAMATLQKPEVNREFDPECVVCHVVGMMYETGYRSMAKTAHLADVGCEACHGPGYLHEQAPQEEYRGPFMTCEECHAPEHSPNFLKERDAYFEKIKHWTEPRKYWK